MPADREASYEYTVREEDVLERLDKFISNLFDDHSRTTIQKMIDVGLVRVNGKNTKSSYVVKPGDFLEIDDLPLNEQDITPEDIPLDIVYEDDSVMVVNKPSGMVVHPAPGNYSHTLVNALVYHIDNLPVKDDRLRPGIVHRIDKDTSGLIMVAKTEKAQILLQDELKRKQTKREYIALLDGVILNETGTIDAPIGRDTKDRKKMAVVKDGKPAITHFEVLERFFDKTLVSCRLETGRTHQIRVHMAYIGFPLVGDYVYNPKVKKNDFGQYLHAKTIGFTHPETGKWMEFSTELPDTFQEELDKLREEDTYASAFPA